MDLGGHARSVDSYAVFDLTSLTLRFSKDKRSLAVLSRSGELLALRDVHQLWSQEECALRAFDEVLSSGRVLRFVDGELTPCPVGLYNPLTREVAIGSLPATTAFSDGHPLECQAAGLVMKHHGETLHMGTRALQVTRPESFAALTRVVLAHTA